MSLYQGKRYAYISYSSAISRTPSVIEAGNDFDSLQTRFFNSGNFSGCIWDFTSNVVATGNKSAKSWRNPFGNDYTNKPCIYEATSGARDALQAYARNLTSGRKETVQPVGFNPVAMSSSAGATSLCDNGRYAYCSYGFVGNTPTVVARYDDLYDAEIRFHGGGNYSAIVFDTQERVICLGTVDRGRRGAGPGGTYLNQPLMYDTNLKISVKTAVNYIGAGIALGAAAVATGGVAAACALGGAAIQGVSTVGDVTQEIFNNSNVGRLVALCAETWGLALLDPNLADKFRDGVGRYAYLSYGMTSNTPTLFARYDSLDEAQNRFFAGGNYTAIVYDSEEHCVAIGTQDRGWCGRGKFGSYLEAPLMYATDIPISWDNVGAVLSLGGAIYNIRYPPEVDPGSVDKYISKYVIKACGHRGNPHNIDPKVVCAWRNKATSAFNLLMKGGECTTTAVSIAKERVSRPFSETNLGRLLELCASKGW